MFTRVAFLICAIELTAVKGEEVDLPVCFDVEQWVEVPAPVYERLVKDPWFSNSSDWRVNVLNGTVLAKPLKMSSMLPSFDEVAKEYGVLPGAVLEVEGGFLVSLYSEHQVHGREVNSVVWVPNNGKRKLLHEGGWVMQFLPDTRSGDVLAATDSGIVRFCGKNGWQVSRDLDFDFGIAYGISHSSDGGMIVFSQTGWWQVGKDKLVTRIGRIDEIDLIGISIAKKSGRIYLGGAMFVTELRYDELKLRRLMPSSNYLNAMQTMTRVEFDEYLKK